MSNTNPTSELSVDVEREAPGVVRDESPAIDGERKPSLQGGRLPRANAWGISVSSAILALTGIALLVLRYLPAATDPFSAYPHPSWRYIVMFHVLATPAFFFFIGSIWWRHAARHWKNRERRWNGGVLVAALVLVAASGYALYFVGSEAMIAMSRVAHGGVGVVAVVLYAHHAIRGVRALNAERNR